jgi:ribosomal protein L37AE/L43A
MDKKFNPEKYEKAVCPICDEYGRIRYPDDIKVCKNCGRFGFIGSWQEDQASP